MIWLFAFSFLSFANSLNITCNKNWCPDSYKGDGSCDASCMAEYCNWDSKNSTKNFDFSTSDCYNDCVYGNNCDPTLLGNGKCNSACNSAECGWDLGDCGYCADSCNIYTGYLEMLDGSCYSACNTSFCYYGESSCASCSENCISSLLGDGVCDDVCNNANCNYDFGDCQNDTCADGCSSYMINDGVCDIACYYEACNYDGTDCDCAPGCSVTKLLNDVCESECNNAACMFDNYACGDCNSGCFYANVSDGVCQSACWVSDCDYDGDDCQCSQFCNVTNYGQCNENCMTADCFYDQFSSDTSKQCKNTTLMLFYMHLQLVNNDLSTIQKISDCSDQHCQTEMLLSSQSTCVQNCDVKQCAYSWLKCQAESTTHCHDRNCQSCYGVNDGECYTCNSQSYQFYGFCLRTCPCGYTAKTIADSYPLCLPSDDESTIDNPAYYYVTALTTSDQAGGNGTLANPFDSLSLALTAINTKYSVIVLLNDGVHYLTQLNKTNIMSTVAPDSSKPFNSQTHRKALAITTENNDLVYIKPKIDWGIMTITTQNTYVITINNTIFDGNEWVHGRNNCLDGYCSYCPAVTQQFDGTYKDDKGNVIVNFTESSQCQNFHDYNLIEVVSGTYLYLGNVYFKNWRMEENSIILTNGGTVNFYNVNFDNIRTNPSSGSAAVVFQDCSGTSGNIYGCGSFTYSGGSVTRLNNGFEYSSSLTLKGFLRVTRAQDISISGVTFENNGVYSSSNANDDSLLYFEIFRTLKIDSCTFSYNFVYTALIYLKTSSLSMKPTVNNQNQFSDYLIDHVTIQDTFFTHNYGITYCIFAAQYQTELQNINWNNVTLETNGAEKGALIYIYNTVLLNQYVWGQNSTVSGTSGSKVKAWERRRTFVWDTITFIDNNSGASGMWDFTKLVNLNISSINMTSNGVNAYDINKILISDWKENTDIYLKNLVSSSTLDFSTLASMNSVLNMEIRSSTISKNYAIASTPYLLLKNSNITVFNDVVFEYNSGTASLPTVLYINGGNQTDIVDSTIKNNYNNWSQGMGTIYAQGSDLVMKIKRSSFNWNTVYMGGGVLFSGYSLSLVSSYFTNNYAYTKGAGISILQSISEYMIISINSCDFTENHAMASQGGAIYIQNSGVTEYTMTLAVKYSNFNENNATYGSAIYIDSSVSLNQYGNSALTYSNFVKNNSTASGALALYYLSGVLYISSCAFTSNIGRLGASLHIEISAETTDLFSRLEISSTEFTSNSGLAVIYTTNSDIYSYIITKNCIFTQNTAMPLTLDYDHWEDTDSVISYNVGKYSGGVRMIDTSLAVCQNTVFSYNEVKNDGGCISSGSGSYFYCESCSFIGNTAAGSGGAIFVEQKSFFNITKTTVKGNKCSDKGAAIYMLGSTTPISIILNSTISTNNSTNEAVIALLDSSIDIESSIITQNIASYITPGILLTLSKATIASSDFSSQSGDQGSFIYATTQSTATITNTTFTDGTSSSSAGAIFSISSTVNIYNGTFNRNNAKNGGGGVILSYSSSTLLIKNSAFYESYSKDVGGVIIGYESDLDIENTIMKNYKLGAIYGSKMNSVVINDSKFYNGVGSNGGSLTCISCISVSINNCYYQGNTADTGGAIYLSTSSDTEITNPYIIKASSFWNNSASLGGGIYTNDISLNVSSSVFVGNIANTTDEIIGTTPTNGNGGGINIACSDFSTCVFNITFNSFIENYAKYNGGGINWIDVSPIAYGNTFSGNKADYASEISSFAIKLMAVDKDGSLVEYDRMLSDDIPTATSISGIASGQETTQSVTLALVDYYGNIVTTDSSSTAQLLAENSTSTTLSGTTKTTAIKGLYYFDSFIVSAKPGTSVAIKTTSTGIDTTKQSKIAANVTFVSSVTIDVTLRLCIIGEATVGVNCDVCGSGYYSLDPTYTQCLACPSHSATCYGNYTIVPQPGYWRSSNMSENFISCPKSAACLGSPLPPNLSFTGVCSEGYKGNLCQACEDGYSRTSTNTCGKCPSKVSNAFKVIGIMVAVVIICGVMVKTTKNSAYKPKSVQSIYIKIFVNYLQIVMLVTTFDLKWPSSVTELFSIQNNTGSVSEQVFSFDCFLDTGQGNDQVYFNKLILMSIIPTVIALISFIFWGSVAFYRHSLKSFKNDLISTIVILLFLFHPNLVKTMFSVFSCREIDSGEYWLVQDLDIRCWDGRHVFYSLVVAVPSIIVWGIGIPTVSLYFLWRNKRKLDTISVRLRFGFLFNGYKAKSYYWEFVILYRKILIVCCSVFLANVSTSIQALTVMMLLLVCLYFQNVAQPYDGDVLNQMEIRSILVAAVTIYCGLYYLTGSLDSVSKVVFFLIICAINIYFLYYWLKKMFGAGFQILTNLIPCLRRRFSRKVMDGFSDEIFEKQELNHVKLKQGEKYFSMMSNDDPMSALPIHAEIETMLNMDMKKLFLHVVENKLDAAAQNKNITEIEDIREETLRTARGVTNRTQENYQGEIYRTVRYTSPNTNEDVADDPPYSRSSSLNARTSNN